MLLKEFVDGTTVQIREIIPSKPHQRLTIGRGFSADFRVAAANKSCSRIQATLQRQGDTWELLDGDGIRPSRNGIWYKGERISDPLIIESNMLVDVFLGGPDQVQLHNIHPDSATDSGAMGELVTEVASLRQDFERLQQQLDLQGQQVNKMADQIQQLAANGEAIADLRADMDDRFDSLAQSILDAVNTAHARDELQDNRIAAHSGLIQKVGLSLAASLLGVTVWTATRSTDTAVQAINLVLGVGGGVGGAVVLSSGDRRAERD